MSSDTDHLMDRRRLKRRLLFWRVVAVFAIATAALVVYGRFSGIERGPYVAHITIDGLILRDDERDEAISRVADDPNAKALIVEIDSPGGTFVASENLFREIRTVSASNRPVVAVIGNTGASGGYMAAIAADRIIVQNGTITGSIGVILQSADITGLLSNIGIKPEVVKSGPLKAQPNPVEPLSDAARENLENVVGDLHNSFVNAVASRRSLAMDEVRVLSDGRIFSGRQAVGAGLADEIGGIYEARAWLNRERSVDEDLPLHDVTPVDEIDRIHELVGTLLGKALFSERLTLDGVLALWHPQLGF